jgi:hypothetical protein
VLAAIEITIKYDAVDIYKTLLLSAHHNMLQGLDPFGIKESTLDVCMHTTIYIHCKWHIKQFLTMNMLLPTVEARLSTLLSVAVIWGILACTKSSQLSCVNHILWNAWSHLHLFGTGKIIVTFSMRHFKVPGCGCGQSVMLFKCTLPDSVLCMWWDNFAHLLKINLHMTNPL